MKKRDKIYNSPEYKQIREHLPEILEELEKDKGLKEYEMPAEWDNDFEQIYRAERRKEHIRNRILAGTCAAVILGIGIVHLGERLELGSVVQADEIGETKENGFEEGEYQYSLYGNVNEEEDNTISEDEIDINFTCEEPVELYEQIKQKTKLPIFVFGYIPEGYTVNDASYNSLHRNLSYRFGKDNKYIYVNQQMQIEDTGNGSVSEEKAEEVYLEKLGAKTEIYKSTQDNSLKCSIVHNNTVLFVISNLELEEFKEIITSTDYQ